MTASRTPRRITISDVAARASVDSSVVSRVLSGDPRLNVRPETRERVLRVVAELDYRPNATARSLRTRRAEAFGLVIPDFADPIDASIITGAQTAAAQRGCLLLAGSLSPHGLSARHYVELLERGRVDGLLVAGAETGREVMQSLAASGAPWLLVNRRSSGSRRFVVLDDERAASLAVGHLAGLGHTRIGYLAGTRDADTAERRRASFVSALRAMDLPAPRSHVVRGGSTGQAGREGMGRLLQTRPRPTAVFVANVAAAIGALTAVRDAGLTAPGQVSVIAVHDSPLAEFLTPPLTTVRMPVQELGSRALELLATTAADDPIEETISEGIELVRRGSTGPPRG